MFEAPRDEGLCLCPSMIDWFAINEYTDEPEFFIISLASIAGCKTRTSCLCYACFKPIESSFFKHEIRVLPLILIIVLLIVIQNLFRLVVWFADYIGKESVFHGNATKQTYISRCANIISVWKSVHRCIVCLLHSNLLGIFIHLFQECLRTCSHSTCHSL